MTRDELEAECRLIASTLEAIRLSLLVLVNAAWDARLEEELLQVSRVECELGDVIESFPEVFRGKAST